MSRTYRSSRPDKWTHPRGKDARHMTHGPIEPLDPDDALGPIVRLASGVGFVAIAASLIWSLL